jgi:hypothetical protein
VQGLINFEKRTLMATAISEIQQYQQTLYCLEGVPFIQEWIESEEVWSSDQVNEATVMLMIKPEKTKPIKKATLKVHFLQCPTVCGCVTHALTRNALWCGVGLYSRR